MKKKVILVLCMLLLLSAPASAMHIMEGFLPVGWAALWGVLCMPFLAAGYFTIRKKVACEPKMLLILAVAGAFTFVVSALKMPSLTGSCSHPTGIGLGAILFGPFPMSIVGLIVLLFQALLLAHGGVSTLGANVFSMAIVGSVVAYGVYRAAKSMNAPIGLAVFLGAFFGDLLTYITTSAQLALAFPASIGGFATSFMEFMGIFTLTQLPLAISEGLLTVVVFSALSRYSNNELSALTGAEIKHTKRKAPIIIMLSLTAALTIIPMIIFKNADFVGADELAQHHISNAMPNYVPWITPVWEPPSGEVESLLFTLQAVVGAGFLGFYFGRVSKKNASD